MSGWFISRDKSAAPLRWFWPMSPFVSENQAPNDTAPVDVFAALEGGYNLDSLPHCINNFINGVNGDEIDLDEALTESDAQTAGEFESRMSTLEKNLSSFWKI